LSSPSIASNIFQSISGGHNHHQQQNYHQCSYADVQKEKEAVEEEETRARWERIK
jgi:hypothetical protein